MSQKFEASVDCNSQAKSFHERVKTGAEFFPADYYVGQERGHLAVPPILLKLTFAKGILLPILIEFPLAAISINWIYSGVTAIETSSETLWARPFGICILLGLVMFCFALTTDGLFRVFKRIQQDPIFSISAEGVQSFKFWRRRTWAWNEIEKVEVTQSNALFASPRIDFIRKGLLSSKARMPSITKKQRAYFKQAIIAFAPRLPIYEQTPFWGSDSLGHNSDALTIKASAPLKIINPTQIKIDPIAFYISKSNAFYGGGAVVIGSLFVWYAVFYLAWADYKPTEHWFELGRKLSLAQDFLIQAFSYPPLVRTVPVFVGGVLLIIDGLWRIAIFNAKRPFLKIDPFGVSAFKFWSPIKLAWAEIEEIMRSDLRRGNTKLALFGKHTFGKPTSGFPFFQILRPQINLYHLNDEQMRIVESLIAHNVPHIKRTLQTQNRIIQITGGQ